MKFFLRHDVSPLGTDLRRLIRTATLTLLLATGLPFAAQAQTPFHGTPSAIPGTIEAEDFDFGGEGIAYHDNTPGNQDGQYRLNEDVDIIVSADSAGGGYVVNIFETGEWLGYTVNVSTRGNYYVELRAVTNSGFPNSAFHIEVDGVNVTGTVVLPTTDNVGWSNFQWIGKRTVVLDAGTHFLKVVSDQQYFNLNQIRVSAAPTPSPFSGTPIAVPATFEAENFDLGGEGVAYHDNTPGNQDGQYRLNEDVDIIVSADSAGGGYVVNIFETGEWLNYTINVPTTGNYDIDLRAVTNSGFPNSAFHIEVDGVNVTGTVVLPTTDNVGWSNFQWIGKRTVALKAGTRFLKVVSDQQYFNLNQIRVLPSQVLPSNLVFWSGYENFTIISPVRDADCWQSSLYNGCWQDIVGRDSSTGFEWPPNIWNSGVNGKFQLIADDRTPGVTMTGARVGEFMSNQIRIGEGRNGSLALFSEVFKSGCCGTAAQDTANPSGATQDVLMVQPQITSPAQESDLYVSFWIKFQSDLLDIMRRDNPLNNPNGTWRAFFEWKTSNDYRVIASVVTWCAGGALICWNIRGDNVAGNLPRETFWEVFNNATVPIGEWFKFEVFWHRSGNVNDNSGRVWTAVNGQVIADASNGVSNIGCAGAVLCDPSPPWNTSIMGRTTNPDGTPNPNPINRIMIPNLYSGSRYPIYQWVDDVQIWNGFPTAAPGDRWYDPPYAPH